MRPRARQKAASSCSNDRSSNWRSFREEQWHQQCLHTHQQIKWDDDILEETSRHGMFKTMVKSPNKGILFRYPGFHGLTLSLCVLSGLVCVFALSFCCKASSADAKSSKGCRINSDGETSNSSSPSWISFKVLASP
jgi:hypothetical protein